MKNKIPSLICLFAAFSFVIAQEKIDVIPATVKVEPGRLFVLEAVTESDVDWDIPPEFKDVGKCDSGKKLFIVAPQDKGELVIRAAVLKDGKAKLVRCVVSVGVNPNPNPPNPKPNPNPPAPQPITDPLHLDLLALYESDQAANKRDVVNSLASLFKVAATYARDPEITTVGMLANVIRTASSSLVGNGLTPFRRRVSEEIGKVLGTVSETPLTFDSRGAAERLFLRLQSISEAIGK